MIMQFILLALLSVIFSVNPASATKTFVYCSEATPSTLDPAHSYDGAAATAGSKQIFNRLVEFKTGTTQLVPGLASAWKVSKDRKTYTFTLRKGVKWHSNALFKPTRDFNADDVLFTFHRMSQKNHPYHPVGGEHYEFFESMNLRNVIGEIKKISSSEIHFVLTRAEAPFLAILAMDFASIQSQEYGDVLKKAGKENSLITDPIGTGPFIFQKYVKDQTIRYTSHAQYWNGKAPIDQLVFVITPDASVRLQKLRTGECHLAAYLTPADNQIVKKDPHLYMLEEPGLNVGYVAMNMEKEPFNKLEVRQAISHALNRPSYLQAIYLGTAVPAKNPVPPTMWGYHSKNQTYPYDVAKAKALLKKAGYPNGFETELWTLPVSRPYNPNGKKMAEMMQSDLAQVGIRAKLVTYDWATYLKKTSQGEHFMAQFGWSADNGDPDNFLDTLLSCSAIESGSNRARWCNKEYEQLVKAAKTNPDQKFRTAKYMKAQEIFYRDAPWVPIAHALNSTALSKKVKNYKVIPTGHHYFYGVDLVP